MIDIKVHLFSLLVRQLLMCQVHARVHTLLNQGCPTGGLRAGCDPIVHILLKSKPSLFYLFQSIQLRKNVPIDLIDK